MKRIIALVAFMGVAAVAASAQDLFLQNARVVDPAMQEVREGNLRIIDGRIAGLPTEVPSDFTAEVIDLEGRWVIPGLADLHTHSYGNMAPGGAFESVGTAVVARRYLYCGVTGLFSAVK